ncbi:hypothetical protein PHJA_000065500 [Phtheirospermum japonicum]|uniref:Uncharacterized protein n=1 Tax=Phtheirospermum japonicum TaxID=374723 RepID=A0A830AX74_9LAMI|nr:hypothetical protein PHJA_000065500 [Phtheirospermum japonicum]
MSAYRFAPATEISRDRKSPAPVLSLPGQSVVHAPTKMKTTSSHRDTPPSPRIASPAPHRR